MPRAKKEPKYEYGIEITKPWSKEMYDHNDKVLEIAKQNVQAALDKAYAENEPTAIVGKGDRIIDIAHNICYYNWRDFENHEVYEDACKELNNTSYHYMHDIYDYMVQHGLVKPLEQGFVGYSK
jgi:hypothetical protein